MSLSGLEVRTIPASHARPCPGQSHPAQDQAHTPYSYQRSRWRTGVNTSTDRLWIVKNFAESLGVASRARSAEEAYEKSIAHNRATRLARARMTPHVLTAAARRIAAQQ